MLGLGRIGGLQLLERTSPPKGKTTVFRYDFVDTMTLTQEAITMHCQFNDSPIKTPDNDTYGFAPFAESLAKTIRSLEAPFGTTIALHGVWGSGKSSCINLLRHELNAGNDKSLVMSEFKCWWFRGEEAMALAFLQNLHALLQKTFKDKAKDLIPRLGRGVLQAGPVIGSAIAITPLSPLAGFFDASTDLAGRLFPEGDPLDETFNSLKKLLADEDRRFLIIIDDIDRLSPDEALAIFRIVKSFGQLPNVIYLLAFDRVFAEKAVKERYPSEGSHFLEKIIQASFELPIPLRTDLNQAILKSIEEICGPPSDQDQSQRVGEIFRQVVVPYLNTPRDAVRFRNAISVIWPAIANEISIADFIALETLRLFEPTAFLAIRRNKPSLCGAGRPSHDDEREGDPFKPYLSSVDSDRHGTLKEALSDIFPRLSGIEYSDETKAAWNSERRVCVEAHFDTYFRLHLSDETLPIEEVDPLVEKADDREFVQSAIRKAAGQQRRTGTSMVPVFLDELIDRASRVDRSNVEPLLSALFEIHDEIDLDIDNVKGFAVHLSTPIRYRWLINALTKGRFTINERTELHLSASKNASLGWLVKLAAIARSDYLERKEGPKKEEDCLVRKNAIGQLTDRALAAIRRAVTEENLLHHKDLAEILYWWSDILDGHPEEIAEIRTWTDQQLLDDNALVILAKRLINESVAEDERILDLDEFISQLKRLQKTAALGDNARKHVDAFLSAHEQESNGL